MVRLYSPSNGLREQNMTNEDTTAENNNTGTESVADIVVPEKVDWVEKAIEYEATPKKLREPKEKGDFINQLGVPRSTYYREMSKNENVSKMIELCFKQAKFRTPEIIEKMGQKAESGNDASIAQFMEYILEVKKKLELSGDKNSPLGVVILPQKDGSDLGATTKTEAGSPE